jgi:hypothetical protein
MKTSLRAILRPLAAAFLPLALLACYGPAGAAPSAAPAAVPVVTTSADGEAAAHVALYDGGDVPVGACFNSLDLLLPAVTPQEWDARIKAAGGTGRSVQGGLAAELPDLATVRGGKAIAASADHAWVSVASNGITTVETYIAEKSAHGNTVWRLTETLQRC